MKPHPPTVDLSCVHCGHRVLRAPVAKLVELNGRHPVAGMAEPLHRLRRRLGADYMIRICPGCGCVTADVGPHDH